MIELFVEYTFGGGCCGIRIKVRGREAKCGSPGHAGAWWPCSRRVGRGSRLVAGGLGDWRRGSTILVVPLKPPSPGGAGTGSSCW